MSVKFLTKTLARWIQHHTQWINLGMQAWFNSQNSKNVENSLVVQFLRQRFHCQGLGSTPGGGIKISKAGVEAKKPSKSKIQSM